MPMPTMLSILAAIARSLAKVEEIHRTLYERITFLEREVERLKSRDSGKPQS
jgi:uncharacterized small protein (DUF1192 family)